MLHLLLSCAIASVAWSLQPATPSTALRLSLTELGLNKATDIALPLIRAALNGSITVPDVHIDTHVVEPLGHITLDLTNIQLTGFALGSGAVAVSPPSSFGLSLGGIGFEVSLDYKWRKVNSPHASDHGEITATPSGTAFSSTLALAVAAQGYPQATQSAGQTTIEKFDIHFSGKVAWLYNLFLSLFETKLKDAIAAGVTSAVSKVISSKLDAALSKFPLSFHFGGGKSEVDIDTSLTDITVPSSLKLISAGDKFQMNNHATGASCSESPAALPMATPEANSSMIQILIADTALECAVAVGYENGAYEFDFPGGVTEDWLLIIPALPTRYPHKNVSLHLHALEQPSFHATKAAGLHGGLNFAVNSSVFDPAQPTVHTHTHTLGAAVDFGVNVFTRTAGSNTSLVGNITTLSLNLTVIDSNIGHISQLPLLALDKIIIPIIKSALEKQLIAGLPLPTWPGIELVNEKVSCDDGFLTVNSDIGYNPTT